MNYFKSVLRMSIAVIAILQLMACSKTMRWEEEVLLNTGDTIWIKRAVVYSLQGGAGNPFDIKYRPAGEGRIEFKWKEKAYIYKGPGGFKVLAISPSGIPVLVRNADAGRWDATNGYKCTIPFYVQFVPDESGSSWTWPPSIEPWLYNLPTNLLLSIGDPAKMQARYSNAEKMKQEFWNDPRLRSIQKIDPDYGGDLCKRERK